MKKITYILGGFALASLLVFSFPGCIDDTYSDIEPIADTTSMAANTTIAELKSMYPGSLVKLTDTTFNQRDSIIIEGIVTSDDKAGNFYKSIFIEDETGGIEVKLEKTTLYNDYKRGQRIVIYCNGLYLGDYGGLIEIGSVYTENEYRQLGGLEGDVIINKHVFRKGKTLVPVTPLTLTPGLLKASSLSRLVKVYNVQFTTIVSPETGERLTYADKTGGQSVDHILKGCSYTYPSTTFVLRTSGFAKFANDTIPSKNGSIVGILSIYNNTYQLIVRDLNDVNFNITRCN
jgi:hypothetical protein